MQAAVIPFPHSPESRVPSGEQDSGLATPDSPIPPYAPISPPLELMRDCWPCGKVQRFLAVGMFQNGLYAHCTRCFDERVLPWTHTNSVAG